MWISSVDGRQQHQVVRETYDKGVEEFELSDNRQWSPDGTTLLFLSDRLEKDDDGSQIFLIPIAGGEAAPLGTLKGSLSHPRWSPDGRFVAVLLRGHADPDLSRAVLGRCVADRGGAGGRPGDDPGGALLVVAPRGAQETRALSSALRL